METYKGKSLLKRFVARLISFKGSPRLVAGSYALGIFLASTPLIGFKVWIGLLLSIVFRLNAPAVLFGVYLVNPFTGPAFYLLAFFVGQVVTGTSFVFQWPEEATFGVIFQAFFGNGSGFMTLVIGGLLLGIPATFLLYQLVFYLLQKYRPVQKQVSADRTDTYALITGASCGLGKALAVALAHEGKNLILVALPGQHLHRMGEELHHAYGVQVQIFEIDLTQSENIFRLSQEILGHFPVDCLINNAGLGGTMPFVNAPAETLDRIIRLNAEAPTLLTRLLLPELMRHPRAYILNVASMASFSPLPFKSVYSASKAYIYAFSRALREELRGTTVSVSVFHPSSILTNFAVSRRIIEQGSLGKTGVLSAGELAGIALKGMRSGRGIIIPGLNNRLNLLIALSIPSPLRLRLFARIFRKEAENSMSPGYHALS